jgi:hypothetical protein
MTQVECRACHARVASYDVIHVGSMETGYRDLCSRCFHEEMTRTGQLEFEHVRFQPIAIPDASGVKRRFHFRLLHLGDAEADLFELMARLVERMRRALGLRHLVDDDLMGCSIAVQIVRARISCDFDSDERIPLLVIDGREVSWCRLPELMSLRERVPQSPCQIS